MAKKKNQRIYSTNHQWLKMLADEQKNYIGRDFRLDLANNCLTIFALPLKYKAKKESKPKPERDKRSEKFARRAER
jgi:hypothetical protein